VVLVDQVGTNSRIPLQQAGISGDVLESVCDLSSPSEQGFTPGLVEPLLMFGIDKENHGEEPSSGSLIQLCPNPLLG
jgi:hypothetical protein